MNKINNHRLIPSPVRRIIRRLYNPYKAITLQLFITQNCNLRCNHCQYLLQNPNHFSTDTDMPLELLEKILKRDGKHVQHISLSAEGEPTVHRHFEEVLHMCAQTGVYLSMVTNGVTNTKKLKTIVRNVDSLMISLDGIDVATYQRKRGGEKEIFEQVVNIIHEAKKLKNEISDARLTDLCVNFVIEKESLHLIEPTIRFCADLGVHVTLNNFVPTGDSSGWSPVRGTDPEVIKEYNRLTSITDWGTDVDLPRLVGTEKDNNFCRFLFRHLVCNYTGNLTPCCYIPSDKKFGNILDSPQPWNSKGLKRFRRQFTTATCREDLPLQCQSCHIRQSWRYYFDKDAKKWHTR